MAKGSEPITEDSLSNELGNSKMSTTQPGSPQLPEGLEKEDSLLAQLLRGDINTDDPVLQAQYFDNGKPVSYVPNLSQETQFAIKLASILYPNSATQLDPEVSSRPSADLDTQKSFNMQAVLLDAVPSEFILSDPSSDVFDIVHGRLTMGGNQTSYFVTTEEMKRRLSSPEKLNSSSLACNLKRTKLKNGGEIMRSQLRHHGIDIQLNCKQAVFNNKVIALTEAEAVHLALDLETIVNSDYPLKEIIEEVAQEAINNDEAQEGNIVEAMSDVEGFLECMAALEEAVISVVPPITGIHARPSTNFDLNNAMETYSNATHGFGIIAQRIWLRQLKKIGEGLPSALQCLEANVSLPQLD